MNKKAEFRLKIIETHLDFLGHVNNATYLQLFEEARWDYINQQGFGVDKIQSTQTGPVILSVEMKFLKELRLREDVSIWTEFLSYEGKIGKMRQTLVKADGAISCDALFTFGLFDLRERKLLVPTQEWMRVCGYESV